jgi:hypothetical protein
VLGVSVLRLEAGADNSCLAQAVREVPIPSGAPTDNMGGDNSVAPHVPGPHDRPTTNNGRRRGSDGGDE